MPRTSSSPVTARRGPSANVLVTIVVVVVAAVVFGGVLLSQRDGDADASAPLSGPDSNTLTQAADGRVTVVEFLDYQCPACAGYYASVTRKLEQDYAGRITFVTRNFPLEMHPLAVQAAQAAEAAALQGRYREMYHALYDNYQDWAIAPGGSEVSSDTARAATLFGTYARDLGLDLGRFHADATSDAVRQRIDTDRADGQRAGVTSTPTIFVDGARFDPAGGSYAEVDAQLRGQIDEALAQ
ncbi:thioredoxin domain-containing protein [Amycolatopsis endophytica]|uniref:Protein-disulfide isomerase n=1 Tax=Amycolatopsis endophytica TaxID=860233 RepID=A0A853B984_9PSEU|nr:thioredoxin domain-containing protein [Amycolatopsis endophytica]NYI91355.1 protein-disulfide isomerase [Amycolatopsis endophytica]